MLDEKNYQNKINFLLFAGKKSALVFMINLSLKKILLMTYFVSKFLYLARLFLLARQFQNDRVRLII